MRFYSLTENDVEQFKNRKIMKEISRSLNENENFVNYKVAEGLGEFSNKKIVETLINALNEDDDESVKEMVINTLGRMGDRKAVAHLISNLDSLNDELKELIILALGEIGGKESLEFIKLALEENKLEIKLRAIEALGKISYPESTEELVYTLLEDNLEIKLYAIASLGEIGDAAAIRPLRKFLNNRKWIIRKYSLNSLGKITECPMEVFINALEDEDCRVREKAVEIIGIRGDENSIDRLNRVLDDPDEDVKLRASEILKKYDKLDFILLPEEKIERIDDINEFVNEIGKDEVVENLIDYLEEDKSEIKDNLTEIFDVISQRMPEIQEEIKEEIGIDSSQEKIDIKSILEDEIDIDLFQDEEIDIEPLLYDLMDNDYIVWWGAKEDLRKLGEPAVMPLINLLDDENQTIRGRVVLALSEIGDERAIAPLIEHLEYENTVMRKKISLSLNKFGKNAVPPLIDALEHEDFEVRESAAEALGEIGEPDALEPLERASNDENVYVRNRAEAAIRRIIKMARSSN